MLEAKLYICPTPIGNLGDITKRALDVLAECDYVYAEDTRVTKHLLSCLEISKPVLRLDENCMAQKMDECLEAVREGKSVAYCSDAGMPGVSDPGLRLIAAVHEKNISVEVLPGASAVTTAYVASGFTNPRFMFAGFFPRKAGERKSCIKNLQGTDCVVVFYESAKRIVDAVKFLSEQCPETNIAVCRELTKIHEEIVRGTCTEVYLELAARNQIKGEIAFVLDFSGKAPDNETCGMSAQYLAKILDQNKVTTKDASKIIAATCGISKNEAYKLSCDISS